MSASRPSPPAQSGQPGQSDDSGARDAGGRRGARRPVLSVSGRDVSGGDDDLAGLVARVLGDLSWLEECTCGQYDLAEFFVPAGRALAPRVRRAALACPVRRQEVIFAYARGIDYGYFGALSPGERARMTLSEALAVVDTQTAALTTRDQPARR